VRDPVAVRDCSIHADLLQRVGTAGGSVATEAFGHASVALAAHRSRSAGSEVR
jgi:hypothetical protein